MEYNFKEIEARWQQRWRDEHTYRVGVDPKRPKYYVLDMFPYPSGAGLHVGHPLGYIASDIFARYKRLKGFNVLHPMGYDAFGLPAEQYAIQTGQHPAVTTAKNIARYREQLDKIGFSFDWEREVRTCDPAYYKWTQWVFLRLFDHYYDNAAGRALPIAELVARFEQAGNAGLDAACTAELHFTADEWNGWSDAEKERALQNYRLAFRADTMVNWCPKLGTVLANDEVRDGLSVRGGYPVEQKRMKQWLLRVTAYAQRMLDGLDALEWSDSLKEIQRNWIGRSEGAQLFFDIAGSTDKLEIFTTRPDTIFGVTFMVVAPEHEQLAALTTEAQRAEVEAYVAETRKRSERERMAEVELGGQAALIDRNRVATGENPVVVACRSADIIIGPIGIVISDSLLGEVTERMALAVARADAVRILIPLNRCDNLVAGVPNLNAGALIADAVAKAEHILTKA